MPEAQRHTIRRQFLEVEIDGDEREGAALHRALPDLCARLLAPAIEQALDRHAPREGLLAIERIEIDAGNVPVGELSEKLPRLVADALEKELNNIPNGDGANFLTDNARLRTVAENVIEAFLFFLENGTLPWSFSNAPGSGLEREITEALKEASRHESLPAKIKSALFETLRSSVARQRLVRQFSPAFIRSIPGLFAAGERQSLDSLLRERGKERAGNLAGNSERHLLEAALTLIVSGISLTETSLCAALQRAASATGEPKAGDETGYRKKQTDESPEDRAQEQAVSQPDASADAELTGQRQSPAGSAGRHADRSARPGNVRDDGGNEPEVAIGDHATTEGGYSRTEPNGDADEASHLDERSAAGGQEAHRETGTDGRRPANAGNADQRSGCARASDGENPPAGSDGEAATHAESPLAEPRGRRETEPESRRRNTASGAGQERPDEKRESTNSRKPFSDPGHPDKTTGLYIDHAGLVLLHPFLPQLFRGVGIADGEELLMPNRALCLLHFLATGEWNAPEYELPLMKVLCGLPLEFVAEPEEPWRPEEDEEVTALLSAVIRHWEALKNTSPEGLREAFLKRSGKLSFSGGEWWLQVESKSYDILLDRLPWGISMIQLPWMPEMLRVEWFS